MINVQEYDELLAHVAKDILMPGEVITEDSLRALYFIYRVTCDGTTGVTLADMRSSYHTNPWRFKKTFRKWVDSMCREETVEINKYYKYIPVEVNKCRKITEDDRYEIKNLKRQGMKSKDIAAKYNISASLVSLIVNNKYIDK